jgi:hypothetical protein
MIHEKNNLVDEIEKVGRILKDYSVSSLKSVNHPLADILKGKVAILIQSALDEVNNMQRNCRVLEIKQNDMRDSIKRSTVELMSKQRQLENLMSTDPVFKDQYSLIENELVEQYDQFVKNFQNVNFLKNDLDERDDEDPVIVNIDKSVSHDGKIMFSEYSSLLCHHQKMSADDHSLDSHSHDISRSEESNRPNASMTAIHLMDTVSETLNEKLKPMNVSSPRRRSFNLLSVNGRASNEMLKPMNVPSPRRRSSNLSSDSAGASNESHSFINELDSSPSDGSTDGRFRMAVNSDDEF